MTTLCATPVTIDGRHLTTSFGRIPRLKHHRGNPNGCWDFWGYTGQDYYSRDGKQMAAVKMMIDRLLGY